MNKITVISLITTLTIAYSSQIQAKSVDYYFNNISEARKVSKDCMSKIKTPSEYFEIINKDKKCGNAELALQRWNKEYNRSSGKTVTKTEPIRFN